MDTGAISLREAASILRGNGANLPPLAFLPRTAPDGAAVDAALGLALRGEDFETFRADAFPLAAGRPFLRRNGVAGISPIALRRADYSAGLRAAPVRDEIYPALVVVGRQTRGPGNHK